MVPYKDDVRDNGKQEAGLNFLQTHFFYLWGETWVLGSYTMFTRKLREIDIHDDVLRAP